MQSTLFAKIFGDREDPRRRLQQLFGGELPTAGQPPAAALVWARGVLSGGTADAADVGDAADAVTATAVLRRAEPRLTLRAATFLAEHALR